jgi:hypothetical protein
MRWTGHVAPMGGMINSYNILAEIPKIKRPLERTRCKQGDNIKINIKEEGYEDVK